MPKLIPKRFAKGADASAGTPLRKPELLAPAGDWECARAAVENGADAIFFGLNRFNARMRGKNFTEADLPDLMAFLHSRGVKGYVTFNTLVFADELQDAEHFLRSIIAAGVDAAIVQDVGICRLIRQLSPNFPIHASTQMSVTSEAGVTFARELGCSVVVLARECSLKEVADIRQKNLETGIEVPLEIFVHGALCVAYSGQCLTSESLGGRSANRGECAQACRLPYELHADGAKVDLGERRYLLSPQDLAGIEALPDIIRTGVSTLKIEGRLKSPEYVAAVSKAYRQAIDEAWEAVSAEEDDPDVSPESLYSLEMTFSRGLSTGWLGGIDNQKLVHARYGKKRGVRLGAVLEQTRDGVWIEPEAPLRAGDGAVFDRGRPDEAEQGGRIVSVDTEGRRAFVRFLQGSVNWREVHPGDILYKTSDPVLEKALRQSYEGDAIRFRRPVVATIWGQTGDPLRLELRDEDGHVAAVESSQPLEYATGTGLDDAALAKQLGRLGGTPFELAKLDNRLIGACHLPVSQLNALRRDAADQLAALRAKPRRWTLSDRSESVAYLDAHGRDGSPSHPITTNASDRSAFDAPRRDKPESVANQKPTLIPYVRSFAQLERAIDLPYPEIYIELENPRDYAKAVEMAAGKRLWVAPPRIFKQGEDRIIRQLEACGAYGFLARNHEHLRALAGYRLRGDFSFNVSNPLTASYLIERYKLERLTASYDLNAAQLAALLENAPPAWFEITLHQHMPMFHMEHCVFCAFLSQGKDYRDCGRPCDSRSVSVKDRVGALHPLKADAGCRNTLFNARAQTGAEFAQDLIGLGVRTFRIEFLNETPEAVAVTLENYERLLAGSLSGEALWKELKLINQLGVTRGTLR